MKTLLTDIFDCIFIVNLPERVDRRLEIEDELKKINISINNEKVIIYKAIKPKEKAMFPSIGSRGCFLSHLEILKQARAKKMNSIVIIEDDLAISSRLQNFIPNIASALGTIDWSILYLGHIEEIKTDKEFELVLYHKPVMTTHFYAVNANIFDRLIFFLESVLERPSGHPDGGPMHYDGALSTFRQQNSDMKTLLVIPNLGWQRSSRSDVASAKWFDVISFIKPLITRIRKFKNKSKKYGL